MRRLPLIKLGFNLAQLALAVCVAFVITRAIAGDAVATDPRMWLALYVATIATGALTIACIAGAIAIAEGGMSLATLRQMFAMDGVVTAANSSIAVAAAVLIATDPRAVFVLLVPSAIVFGVYRAYISERQRHEKLEFLYEANRALTRSPEVAEAIEGVLARSLEAFHSRDRGGRPVQRRRDRAAHDVRARQRAGDDGRDRPPGGGGARGGDRRARPRSSRWRRRTSRGCAPTSRSGGIRHAMVAMLPGENRMIGTIMLANRLGIERGYSTEDQRLLELLANNASVALQYDRLEQAVIKLRSLQDQLHHQAYHDPLTDLPNRALFMERVRDELAERTGTVAVLFIDVDDFKVVNDTLGHAVGDALLVSVAGRLRHCVRPQDVVARLGGDEFAVMLPDVEDPAIELHNVARRILRAFEAPVNAGSELVAVHLSVGITHSAPQRRRRRADPRGRPRDVPGQGEGQGAVRVLRPDDGRGDAAPARPQGGAREGDRARGDPRRVPADRVAADGPDLRRRGARALAASRPRAGRAVGVHPAGRGDRADPRARPPRAHAGLPAVAALARRRRRRSAAAPAREPVGRAIARSRS